MKVCLYSHLLAFEKHRVFFTLMESLGNSLNALLFISLWLSLSGSYIFPCLSYLENYVFLFLFIWCYIYILTKDFFKAYIFCHCWKLISIHNIHLKQCNAITKFHPSSAFKSILRMISNTGKNRPKECNEFPLYLSAASTWGLCSNSGWISFHLYLIHLLLPYRFEAYPRYHITSPVGIF